jgi:hypothetical protein
LDDDVSLREVALGREESLPAAGTDHGLVAETSPYQMRTTGSSKHGKAQRRNPMPTSDADRGIRA